MPDWFGADLLPEDFEAVEGHWTRLAERLPIFERAGIARNVRGPICIAPDNLPLAGPAWGLRNFWLAEGVSGGILMGGGLGHYLGGWIVDGTGDDRRRADLGIVDGRIVALGDVDDEAAHTIDADGRVVPRGSSTSTPTSTPSPSGTAPSAPHPCTE